MRKSQFYGGIFFGLLLIVLSNFNNTFGQEFRGTITGTVTDANSEVVVGATVVVRNIETNISNTVTTNEQGSYTVPLLLPGNYSVSVTNEGFKTSTRGNINLKVDDRLTVDVQLEIGSTTEEHYRRHRIDRTRFGNDGNSDYRTTNCRTAFIGRRGLQSG